ncbi:MAG: HD domain-containing protein [Clostridia bacterium]|nr:HD domain-containing protein [Clostridia bacterium]
MEKVTLEKIKSDKNIHELIDCANKSLKEMGYTEHGLRHVGYVSKTTSNILRELGYDERTVELGAIAGWMHDIGNAVNRKNHGPTGSVLAFELLRRKKMAMKEIGLIIGAIGNHEEETGLPVSAISAALILADKSDAHRSRVRKSEINSTDIHDRVNLSIKKNTLVVDNEKRVIRLVLYMDATCAPMDYLKIYMSRMELSEKAADYLGCTFELIINGLLINRHTRSSTKVELRGKEKKVSSYDDQNDE